MNIPHVSFINYKTEQVCLGNALEIYGGGARFESGRDTNYTI
jgi:hypothetical protein